MIFKAGMPGTSDHAEGKRSKKQQTRSLTINLHKYLPNTVKDAQILGIVGFFGHMLFKAACRLGAQVIRCASGL